MSSTSLTVAADESTVVAEMRFSPWGSVRHSNGTAPSDFTFTGQRSEVDSFGLMYYNARWYDPMLGRFAQADSIIPGLGNPMAWDRFVYVKNNPLNYIDPSGLMDCLDDGYCPESDATAEDYVDYLADQYEIEFEGDWDEDEKLEVIIAAEEIGYDLAGVVDKNGRQVYSDDPIENFKEEIGPVIMKLDPEVVYEDDGQCETVRDTVTCNSAPSFETTIHEFGHILDVNYGLLLSGQIPEDERTTEGYLCGSNICTENDATLGEVNSIEEFADFFLNYILNDNDEYPNHGFTDDYVEMYEASREYWWYWNIIQILIYP